MTAALTKEDVEEARRWILNWNPWGERTVGENRVMTNALCDLALSALAPPPGAPVAQFVMRIKQQRDKVADALRAIQPDHHALWGIPTAEQQLANIMRELDKPDASPTSPPAQEGKEAVDALEYGLRKVRSYIVDSEAGRINWRPHDAVTVIDSALSYVPIALLAPTPPSEKERERLASRLDYFEAYFPEHHGLQEALRDAAKALRQADAPVGWVSVDERLPTYDGPDVLCWSDSDFQHVLKASELRDQIAYARQTCKWKFWQPLGPSPLAATPRPAGSAE